MRKNHSHQAGKRILAVIAAMIMVITSLAMPAFAEGETGNTEFEQFLNVFYV